MNPSKKPHFLFRPDDFPTDLPWDVSAAETGHGYQAWVMKTLQPFIGQRVMELGAGSGNFSRWLQSAQRLILTEPEVRSVEVIERLLPHWFREGQEVSTFQMELPKDSLSRFSNENLNTVISFNVLEHIEDDIEVVRQACELLKNSTSPGPKRLVSFVPAHPFAYGTLDTRAHHFRRYTRSRFRMIHAACAPQASHWMRSFNFPGLWGWILNGRIIRQEAVGEGTFGLFETLLPAIKTVDWVATDLLKIPLGQSLISVIQFD